MLSHAGPFKVQMLCLVPDQSKYRCCVSCRTSQSTDVLPRAGHPDITTSQFIGKLVHIVDIMNSSKFSTLLLLPICDCQQGWKTISPVYWAYLICLLHVKYATRGSPHSCWSVTRFIFTTNNLSYLCSSDLFLNFLICCFFVLIIILKNYYFNYFVILLLTFAICNCLNSRQ